MSTDQTLTANHNRKMTGADSAGSTKDDFASIRATISGLNHELAEQFLSAALERAHKSEFAVGGILSRIKRERWFAPYPSFKDFVQKRTGMSLRRAKYFVSTYEALIRANQPWRDLGDICWSKLREIAPVLTPENIDQWLSVARQSTQSALVEAVRQSRASGLPSSADVSLMTFKGAANQIEKIRAAVNKAKIESGAKKPSDALALICQSYLNDDGLRRLMAQASPNECLAVLSATFCFEDQDGRRVQFCAVPRGTKPPDPALVDLLEAVKKAKEAREATKLRGVMFSTAVDQ